MNAEEALPPCEIDEFVAQLVSRFPNIYEVWLIGSRANGTARPDSDWDLLVFGDSPVRAQISTADDLHRADVDCLVLIDDDRFISAWPPLHSGSLSAWDWHRCTEDSATYTETKWRDSEDGAGWECKTRKAILKARSR